MDGEDINLEDDEDDSIMGRNFEHRGAHLQPAQNYHQDLPDQVFMIFLRKKGDIRFQKKCRNKILNIVNLSEKKIAYMSISFKSKNVNQYNFLLLNGSDFL